MEDFAPNGESQVWQRVFAQPEPKRENLRPLLLSAMEAAAAYRHIAEKLSGRARELGRKLYEEERTTVATLRGIAILSGSREEKIKALPLPAMSVGKLLEKYYHLALRTAAEYTARSVEPEFGIVFQHLAQRERMHCALIAQLLGSLNVEKTGA